MDHGLLKDVGEWVIENSDTLELIAGTAAILFPRLTPVAVSLTMVHATSRSMTATTSGAGIDVVSVGPAGSAFRAASAAKGETSAAKKVIAERAATLEHSAGAARGGWTLAHVIEPLFEHEEKPDCEPTGHR